VDVALGPRDIDVIGGRTPASKIAMRAGQAPPFGFRGQRR